MYNAQRLQFAIVSAALEELRRLTWQLYFAQPDFDMLSPLESSPIAAQIDLLVAVANGESHYERDVAEALHSVTELTSKLTTLPIEWNDVVNRVQIWLNRDELLTLSEAARMLRPNDVADKVSRDRALMYVNDLIKRGLLHRLEAANEPNPKRRGRVLRSEVEELSANLRRKYVTMCIGDEDVVVFNNPAGQPHEAWQESWHRDTTGEEVLTQYYLLLAGADTPHEFSSVDDLLDKMEQFAPLSLWLVEEEQSGD